MRPSLLLVALSAAAVLLSGAAEARPTAADSLKHLASSAKPHHQPQPHHRREPAATASTHLPKMHAHSLGHGPNVGDACAFNGVTGVCQATSSCVGSSTVIDGLCGSSDPSVQCCLYQHEPQPGCGTAAVARARTWAAMELAYCQAPNGKPDAICSPICNRASNPDWDAYRSDCSGLVSYAYGIAAPGRITLDFSPYQNDLTFELPDGAKSLAEGDIINSVPREHVMIFVEWLNDDYTAARFLEEPDCVGDRPYARVEDTQVEILADGHIHLMCNNMTFAPVRFNTNKVPC